MGEPTLAWEIGDLVFWVQIDEQPPFPLTLFRAQQDFSYKFHTDATLTEAQLAALDAFAHERMRDLWLAWAVGMETKLDFGRRLERKRKRKR